MADDQRPCRAEVGVGDAPTSGVVVGLIILGCLACAGGYGLVMLAPDSDKFSANRPQLVLWAVLIGAMMGGGVAVFLVSGTWLRRIIRLFDPKPKPIAFLRWIACVIIAMAVVIGLNAVVAGREFSAGAAAYHGTQINVIIALGAVFSFPGLLALIILRSFAANDTQWNREGARCGLLMAIRVRREVRRVLVALGGFLTLIVIATGARRRAVLGVDEGLSFPADFVVLYGLLFASLLAVIHGAASWAIEHRCQALLDAYAPVPSPDADELGPPLKRRQDLGALLGVGQSWQKSFEGGVFVFAPLLTALLGAALSK